MGVVERTRNTDPATSTEAADTVNLHHSRGDVLALFAIIGIPMTDGELVNAASEWGVRYTPQRIRSARKELTDLGLIRATGYFRPGPTRTRRAHVHALVAA